SLTVLRHDVGMLAVQPGWNGISWRPQDDFDASLVQTINNPIHPGEFETGILWLPTRPCGLTETRYSKPRLAHKSDVFRQPLVGLIFMIVRYPVKHSWLPRLIRRCRLRAFLAMDNCIYCQGECSAGNRAANGSLCDRSHIKDTC